MLAATAGCLPYTVGNTAQTLPPFETQSSLSWYFIPQGVRLVDSVAATMTGLDYEWRRGLRDGASDVGFRIPSATGFIGTYRRRLGPTGDYKRPALAIMVGLGVLNVGQHGHAEVSLLASGSERASVVPYGGVRAMHMVPLNDRAVSDSPTLGGFIGLRIGRRDFGISPEIAVYYDRPAFGFRQRNVIVVPAVTFHGDDLIDMVLRVFSGH